MYTPYNNRSPLAAAVRCLAREPPVRWWLPQRENWLSHPSAQRVASTFTNTRIYSLAFVVHRLLNLQPRVHTGPVVSYFSWPTELISKLSSPEDESSPSPPPLSRTVLAAWHGDESFPPSVPAGLCFSPRDDERPPYGLLRSALCWRRRCVFNSFPVSRAFTFTIPIPASTPRILKSPSCKRASTPRGSGGADPTSQRGEYKRKGWLPKSS